MDTTLQKKTFLSEANIFRGIFCLFVVFIHTTGAPTTELQSMSFSSIAFSIFNTSIRCAVPAFIFVSGLTLAFRYKDFKLSLKQFYYKRFKTVVIPYVLYTIFYYVVFICFEHYEISLNYFLKKLFTGNMVYHLYFVIIIIQFYIVFPIILYLLKKFNSHIVLFIAFVLHIICFIYIPMKYRFFGNYLTFFVLGCYIGFNYNRINSWLLSSKVRISLVGVTLLMTAYYIVELYLERHFSIKLNPSGSTWQIFSLLCIPGYYVAAMVIDEAHNKTIVLIKNILNDISKYSFSIYLGHPFIIMILKVVLAGFGLVAKHTLMSVIMLAACVIYSQLMILVRKKILNNKNYSKTTDVGSH